MFNGMFIASNLICRKNLCVKWLKTVGGRIISTSRWNWWMSWASGSARNSPSKSGETVSGSKTGNNLLGVQLLKEARNHNLFHICIYESGIP